MNENKEKIQTPIKSWDEYKSDMVKEDEKQNKSLLIKALKDLALIVIVPLAAIAMYALAVVFVTPIIQNTRMYGITDIADVMSVASGLMLVTIAYLAVRKMILWIWEG